MNQAAYTIELPCDRLPDDPASRQEVLEGYFGDLLPTSRASSAGWTVELHWPHTEEFFVDRRLSDHLRWWGEGVRLGGIRQEVVEGTRGQLSLDDAWTLFAWSRWLSERRKAGRSPDEVVVIHVDDHTDMMTPRIGGDGSGWRNLFSGESFSVFDPQSVASAVAGGAVGIGSFFAPFLHEIPRVLIRHLSQSAALVDDGREQLLLRQTVPDTVLQPGCLRPSIGRRAATSSGGQDDVAGAYRFSRNVAWSFSDLPDCPVLLHIDMDYFNNRYDRDSDWPVRASRLDPGEGEILDKIDEVFAALGEYGIAGRIENAAVALSPGFFPSEFWAAGVERVAHHLSALGIELGR